MPTIVTSNFAEKLGQLNRVLENYAQVSGRAPADVALRKANQLLLGVGGSRGVRGQGGIFTGLAATAPARGRVTAERQAAGFRVGRPGSRTLSLARERAAALLGGARSGAFRVEYGESGGLRSISRVSAGRILTRGRRKGQIVFKTRSKTALAATRDRGVSRAAARAAGGVLLNRQALTVVLAIALREQARLATAVQFLPSRYRTVLRRRPDFEYRGGQAVGLNSTDAAQEHFHDRVVVQNAKGRALGFLDIQATPGSATLHLRGELGVHTAAQADVIAGAIDLVTADTAAYLLARNNRALGAAARAAGLGWAA